MMNDNIRRVHCGTKKCTGFLDLQVSTTPKTSDGNWQFHCPVCRFWCLLSEMGVVKATARDAFDLERLPSSLRDSHRIIRSPGGGV